MTKPAMVFVFGSNLAGRHGKGAALDALKYHGAMPGFGIGRHGNSYAIPTKDETLSVLPIASIKRYVSEFIGYARQQSHNGFQVTRIGCGLAGFTNEEIAPLFQNAPIDNCFFDLKWRPILGNKFEYWGSQ